MRIKFLLNREPGSTRVILPDDRQYFGEIETAADGQLIAEYSGSDPALLALATTERGYNRYGVYSAAKFVNALGDTVFEAAIAQKRGNTGARFEALLERIKIAGRVDFNDPKNRAALAWLETQLPELTSDHVAAILAGGHVAP